MHGLVALDENDRVLMHATLRCNKEQKSNVII
ncbi:hypothetical protein Clocel_2591 [Clostridium cellulovorans 743B]|uniref:Uncharacterized protein n=1 Tax=Clostridium cellulovorans (strain ATCC 35296 / DSM 3052 / OCM 3 / 743B) TaxID=573061 RepID=D9SQU5_CLOC7|nr:hypothetical protein Clocel_2591 [Clostridium cellulovorans 743B]